MDSVRILHCADLHLGAEVISLKGRAAERREDFLRTFHNILEIAKKEEVSLLLIAGDLFDVPDAPAELCVRVRDAFADAAPLKIAMCSGNHDPAVAGSVYLKEDFWSDNVIIFSSNMEVVELDDIGVRLLGAGFSGTYCSHTQLRRLSLPKDDLFNIGIMHGSLVSEGQGSDYNPITIHQIESSGLDYLALGHYHTRREPERAGGTTYAYSGCTEGRKFGENGEKGVYIVEVGHSACSARFVPACCRRLENIKVDITGLETLNDVADTVRAAFEREEGRGYRDQIFSLTLTGEQGRDLPLNTDRLCGMLSDIWYLELEDDTIPYLDETELESSNSLKGLFVKTLEKYGDSVPKEQLELAKRLGLLAFDREIDV